jgi:hypothetical protein
MIWAYCIQLSVNSLWFALKENENGFTHYKKRNPQDIYDPRAVGWTCLFYRYYNEDISKITVS